MHRLSAFLFLATCVTGCTQGQQTTTSTEPGVPSVEIGTSVAPRMAKLAYSTHGRTLEETKVRPLPDAALTINVARVGERSRLSFVNGEASTTLDLRDDGRLETRGTFPGPVADLVESLPPPNTKLEVGVPYESGTPDEAYLKSSFDDGKAVIWQVTKNTPIAIHADGTRKLVALDVAGYNRAYLRDDAGGIDERMLGIAYRARTDLLYTPETGWVVLRLRRVVQADVKGDAESLDFDDLLAVKHSEFTACLGITEDAFTALTRADFPACF